MNCFCLIPVTRPELAQTIIKSAENDGWLVLTKDGKFGAADTREALFKDAVSFGAEYVRYADDDDLCLYPHRQQFCEFLDNSDYDIVYGNFKNTTRDKTADIVFSGDYVRDIREGIGIAPWTWVAKAKSLEKLERIWDPTMAKGQGSWMILQAASAGLKIAHLPIEVYHYHRYACRPSITEKPPTLNREQLWSWLDESP